MRRRLRRRALRKQDFYQLLEKNHLPDKEELSRLFAAGGLEDIYALRTRALDEAVTPQEFARILLHLMQRLVREQQQTLVMVTHDNTLASYADKQIRIVDGKIVSLEYGERGLEIEGEDAEAEKQLSLGAGAQQPQQEEGEPETASRERKEQGVSENE